MVQERRPAGRVGPVADGMRQMYDVTMLHRTQILLEPWQHDALRALAERDGRSMSELVRSILTEALRPGAPGAGGWIREVAGIAYDAQTRGEDHDAYLYGAPDADA
jgi:hypothetical protein